MRKLFSLFVALLATSALLGAADFQLGDLYYKITNDTLVPYTVEVTYESIRTANYPDLISVTIPRSVINKGKTYSVTSIGEYAFRSCPSLESITIPNSVTSIGEYAFLSCKSLTSITIPNNVTSIGGGTFSGCSSLTSISIPNSVISIGERAFTNCYSLATVTLNSDAIVSNNYTLNSQICTIFGSQVKKYVIGNSVTAIGEEAFSYCDSLTSVTIGNSVTRIGKNAFRGCKLLTSVNIPNSVTSIGEWTFAFCDSLTSITLGNNITSIGDHAFSSCKSLISINIPNSVTSLGENTFYFCDSLRSVTLGNSVMGIERGTFWGCKSLNSITLPNSVTSIGDWSFAFCYSLASVTLGNNVTSIGESAFALCSSLTSINIPNSVTSIGKYAFDVCSSLTSITIGDGVTNIGDSAFVKCNSLDTIYCYAAIPPMVENTFINNDETNNYEAKLYVLCESLETYKAHAVWGQFENVQCIEEEQPQADNLYYRYVMNADNTVLSETLLTQESFDKFTTVSVKGDQQWTFSSSYGATMNGNSVNITYPNEDWLISPALDLAGKANAILSFEHCFGPASAIPTTEAEKAQYTIWVSNDFTGDVQSATWTQLNGMMYGTAAWKYVSSGNIEIPANYLTENCRVAWKYVCEDASAKWEIKNVLVTTPTNQVEVVAGENKYSGDITIPATIIFNGQKCDVVGIAEEAFYDCSALISITIPNSMKHIGEYAFRGCYALEKTNFMGEIADWCDIKFGGAYANPMSASKNLYLNNQEVKDLVIPNTVDSIHAYAFDCGNSITSVALPNSVVYIGEGAFYRTYINEIIIPKSVTSIEERLLSGCNALTSIIVEEGNPVYDSRDNCNAIIETNSNTLIAGCATTDIPNTIMHIGPNAFSYLSSLNTIEIPNSVITIGDHAFYACSSLVSITIPNNVTSIGRWALYACYSLNSIVVEEGNSVYDSRNNCNAIIETATNSLIVACQNTVIPEGVTNIGENAFFNCDALINSNALTSIVLPNTIESIEAFAFSMCSSLNTIYCYAITPPTTNQYAFDNYNATLYVPCESLEAYKAHEIWGRFNTIQCLEDSIPDPTERVLSCAEAVTVCLETGATATTEEYTIHGYVTEITTEYSEQYKNISFYMADTKDGGQVLFTYRIKPMYEADIAVKVGDFVEVVGKLVNYNGYLPEVYPGVYTIVNEPELPTGTSDIQLPTSNTKKVVKDGQLLILRDGVEYTIMGQEL